jgi:hypothetical protein
VTAVRRTTPPSPPIRDVLVVTFRGKNRSEVVRPRPEARVLEQPVDESLRRRARPAMRGMHDEVIPACRQRRPGRRRRRPASSQGCTIFSRASAAPRPSAAASKASVVSLKTCAGSSSAPCTPAARNQSCQPCRARSLISGRRATSAAVLSFANPGRRGEATGNNASSIRWCEVRPG